jgi:hypothetical protein
MISTLRQIRLVLPGFLIFLAVVPDILLRQVFFGALRYPLRNYLNQIPFSFDDQHLITFAGALAAALVWSVIIFILTSVWIILLSPWSKESESNGNRIIPE